MERLLQIFHIFLDTIDAFVKVCLQLGDGFGDELLDASIFVFFLVIFVVLQSAYCFLECVDLDFGVVFLVFDIVGH